MHGAGEAADQATLPERRQRIPRNAVLRMPNVEVAVAGILEISQVIRDTGLDHDGDVTPNWRCSDTDGRAARGPEETSPAHIGRVDRHLVVVQVDVEITDTQFGRRRGDQQQEQRGRKQEGLKATHTATQHYSSEAGFAPRPTVWLERPYPAVV